jgi:hypothetical protein
VGHLCCFHSLAIVKNVAKTWMYSYCNLTYIPSDISLGVEFLDHMVVSVF